jgi:hypothetical protein
MAKALRRDILLMKCSSLHSRQWLQVKAEFKEACFCLVSAGTHSHTP